MKLKKKIGLGVLSLATVLGSTAAMLTNNTSSVSAAVVDGTNVSYNNGKIYRGEDADLMLFYFNNEWQLFEYDHGGYYWATTFHGTMSDDVDSDGIATKKITFTGTNNSNGLYDDDAAKSYIYVYENYLARYVAGDKYVFNLVEDADITSNDSEVINQYIVDNNLKTESEYLEYGESKYIAGQESVDITSNDKDIYDKAFADGVSSVNKAEDNVSSDVVDIELDDEKENGFVSFMKWINKYLFFGLFGN